MPDDQILGVPAISDMDNKQQHPSAVDPDDPLLIAQTLTYVTDDGSVLLSFTSAPFSFAFKLRFFIFEALFLLTLICAVPIGAHGTVVSISIGNLIVVAWFWYNSVRCVDITSDGGLRFWIGNFEMDIPFDKIVSIHRLSGECGICQSGTLAAQRTHDQPHRWGGYFDECAGNAVLGVAEERGEAGEEFGALPMSEVEDCLFARGRGLEFY